MGDFDAIVVGSGPNGLSAAATLAGSGRKVLVVEGAATIGGGLRTEELTLPGFHHDVCSAFHPLAMGSPYLSRLPLADHGLEWIVPDVPLAHALDADRAVMLYHDIAATASELEVDGAEYHRMLTGLTEAWPKIERSLLGPIPRVPDHPVALARFGLEAIRSAASAVDRFDGERARALFAGCAAHAFLPLGRPLSASFGWLLLVTGHLFGWPIAAGGSRSLAEALASYVRSLGGVFETDRMVTDLAELPDAPITILDVTPAGLAAIAGDRLPAGYLRRVRRFRRGPGAFKVDYAIDGPVPWINPELERVGTIHVGGTAEHVDLVETETFKGREVDEPFMLIGQQSVFDPSRAPEGSHTVWAYAHVPNASTVDHTETVTAAIERLAPGFRDRILATNSMGPADLEARNPNNVGGDISGGAHTMSQMIFRPFPQANPYTTPIPGVYLGSSSTPPGAGTHGMCGHHAARTAIARS